MNVGIFLFVLMAGMTFSGNARAALHTEVVEYRQGDAVLEGYLAYDDASRDKRPGVLVVHEWWGLDPYARMRAEQLAGLGYVAFAADIYGKGVRPRDAKEAGAQAGIYRKDRTLMRARAAAALDVLRSGRLVDTERLAAIGYCFGGTVVLEMARGGAPLRGAASFHGGLDTTLPAAPGAVKAKILALHGADDPYAPPAQVAAFEDEMRKAGADWQFVAYGGAVHGFTNPGNGNDNSKGLAYNEKADKRSWEAMKSFFGEIFR